MTPQEAIDSIQEFLDCETIMIPKEALKMGIEALKKDIATPPEEKVGEKYPIFGAMFYCKCGVSFYNWEFDNWKTNFCGNCGQRLLEKKNDTSSKNLD